MVKNYQNKINETVENYGELVSEEQKSSWEHSINKRELRTPAKTHGPITEICVFWRSVVWVWEKFVFLTLVLDSPGQLGNILLKNFFDWDALSWCKQSKKNSMAP